MILQEMRKKRGHRLETLFTVATGMGLRKGEVLGLQWLDVDFARLAFAMRVDDL